LVLKCKIKTLNRSLKTLLFSQY